jgi:AbrB family looped-hinge helix DNA binding protein
MEPLATTRLSSKGQVVIPEEIRKRLKLKPGDHFLVTGHKDVVILKTLAPPRMEDFDQIIAETRRQAKAAGLKKSDIAAAIARARKRK